MIDKFSIHRSKYWQKETCHWKNHQSSNYHVSMLSGKRCETSKCVNTDYFISTSYQLYCEHQCLSVYSATSQFLQANILMWHEELSNLWQNYAHPLQKWSAKKILDISRRTDSTGIEPEARNWNNQSARPVFLTDMIFSPKCDWTGNRGEGAVTNLFYCCCPSKNVSRS